MANELNFFSLFLTLFGLDHYASPSSGEDGDAFRTFFQKSSKLNFLLIFSLVPKSRNHLNFVNISPTLVIDTSMKRSSRVLQHDIPKIWFFLKKKSKLNFDLYFEFWLVGLNMNLYDDIGDASSSFQGSTSSLFYSLLGIYIYIYIYVFI